MDLVLIWLEQVFVWRLQRKEKEAMHRSDKITEHTEYVPNQYTPKHMLDKAVSEYEHGLLGDLVINSDPTVRRMMNEIVVRAVDDAKHGKRR